MYSKSNLKGRSPRDVSHLFNGGATSLYTLGYLYANYSESEINGQCTGGVVVGKAQDSAITERLLQWIGFYAKQRVRPGTDYASSRIASVHFADQLRDHGCVKSHRDRVAPDWCKDTQLFWRGFVDGNGHYDGDALYIQAGNSLMRQFAQFLHTRLGGLKGAPRQRTRLDELRLEEESVEKTLQLLYSDPFSDSATGCVLLMPHFAEEIRDVISVQLYEKAIQTTP